MRWIVDGALAWQRDGLREPAAVKHATAGYRADMDIVGQFLDDTCIADPGLSVAAKDLYGDFKRWAEENGEYVISQRRLGTALSDRGFKRSRGKSVYYEGLGLKVWE